jgi:hypothetical protein
LVRNEPISSLVDEKCGNGKVMYRREKFDEIDARIISFTRESYSHLVQEILVSTVNLQVSL